MAAPGDGVKAFIQKEITRATAPKKHVDTRDRVIIAAENHIHVLEAQERLLKKKRAKELADANAAAARKDKHRAALHVTQIKRIDKHMRDNMQQLSNARGYLLEKQQQSISVDTFKLQKAVVDDLKITTRQIGTVKDIERVTDELQDLRDDAEDLTNAISTPLDAGTYVDGDDVFAELDALNEEENTVGYELPRATTPAPKR
jgi:uncharacterized protein (DUF3084 family)